VLWHRDAVQAKLREIEASLAAINGDVVVVSRDARAGLRAMERVLLELQLKEWDESVHPRDEAGKFASSGASTGVRITHTQRWRSSRALLNTSRLDGAHANAVDPPGLSSATAEQRMLDLYDRSTAQGHAAADVNWYVDKHNQIGQWADNVGVDHQKFADAVAATSPLTAWNLNNSPRLPNLEAARAIVGAERAHADLSPEQIRAITPHSGEYPFLGNSTENGVRALRGENPDEVFNAAKIRSFNNNVSHPEAPFDITVDTHMGRALLDLHEKTPEAKKAVEDLISGTKIGRGPGATTVGGYGWAADRIRNAAATRGVDPPSAFQAVVWEQWRREGGALTTSRAAKMTTDDLTDSDLTDEEVAALWQDVSDWVADGAPADWKPKDDGTKTFEDKHNPYHDERGRFSTSDAAGFVSLWGKPESGGGVAGQSRGIGEDYSASRMQAKREALIAESDRRTGELDRRQKEAQQEFEGKSENNVILASHSRDLRMKEEAQKEEIDRIRYDIQEHVPPEARADAMKFLAGKMQEYDATVAEHNAAYDALEANGKDYNAAVQEYADKIDAITAERIGLNQDLREKYVNAPAPGKIEIASPVVVRPAPNQYGYQNVAVPPQDAPKPWRDGVQTVNAMVGNVTPPLTAVPMREMPPDDAWFNSARSYHVEGSGLTIHPSAGEGTIVHEMGHFIEASVAGATPRIWEHIDSRTQGESNRKLSDITGNNYNGDEVAKPDSFWSAYMGKDYNHRASEFLSMSLQGMYEDPAGFARKDPQSFDFSSRLLAEARATSGSVQPTQVLSDTWARFDVVQGTGQ
jgi:hypothetical protein